MIPTRELRDTMNHLMEQSAILAIRTHARIAGDKIYLTHGDRFAGNPHPRANCGNQPLIADFLDSLAIHTHARIAGVLMIACSAESAWQSTPTRELREDIAAVADSPYRLAIHTHARIAGAIRMQL